MRIKFSFETPIRYMKELENSNDYLYVLAQWLGNKNYSKIVKEYEGMKIIDNGGYELGKSMNIKTYIKYIEKVGKEGDIIILPDYLFNSKKTLEYHKFFYKYAPSYFYKKFKLMGIIQGGDIDSYLSHSEILELDNRISYIGISKTRNIMFGAGINILNHLKLTKNIHLLGLSNPFELVLMGKFLKNKIKRRIKSLDTGMPINFAIKGKHIPKINKWDDYQHISGVDLDYNKKIDTNLVIDNINILKSYLK